MTDGSTGSPVAGAVVAEKTSDASGHVSVTLATAGTNILRATKTDSIRSNLLSIFVNSSILVSQDSESIIY